MNYIDVIILLVLLYGAVRGLIRGFAVELLGIAGLVLGGVCAVRYSGHVAGFLKDLFGMGDSYVGYVAWGLTFLLVVLLVALLARLFTRLLDAIALGLVNRLAGALFGAAKCFLVVSIAVMFLEGMNKGGQLVSKETVKGSLMYQPALDFGDKVGLYDFLKERK